MKLFSFVFALVIASTLSAGAQTAADYKITKTFHIASTAGWDYLAVGPGNNRLYVSHGTQVNILDATTGDSVGVIPNTTGVHGIAFDKKLNKGYTSNGRLNTITVFDLTTNAVLSQIPVGMNPDWIMYEKFSDRIITCNGKSSDLTLVDPATEKVVATIPAGGRPETAVSDTKGHLFLNVEDKNEIAVIDLKTNTVTNRYPLGAEGPTGLDMDYATNRLFVGCDEKLIIMDATNGKIVDSIPIGKGCDAVAFDFKTKEIYASNGAAATLSIVKEESADKFTKIADVPTKKGAKTMAVDKKTNTIYLPTTDYEPLQAGEKRPKMTPGTFQILVLTKSVN